MAKIRVPKLPVAEQAEQVQGEQPEKPSEQVALTPSEQVGVMLDSVPDIVVPDPVWVSPAAPDAPHSDPPGAAATTTELAASPEPSPESGPEPSPAPVIAPTDQDELLDEISRAEQECAAAESVVTELKGELKEAKKDYETCVKRLRKLARRAQADADRPLFRQGGGNVADKSPAGHADAENPAAASNDPDAWKAASITSLDLKPKLIERLQENGIDTIGRLEALRADIALGKEKWPKGVGQAKVTEIENAVVAWLTANRDAALFNGQGEGSAASDTAATSGAESVGTHEDAPPPAPESSSSASETPSATEWELWPDEKRNDWLNARAAQISESLALDSELQRTGDKLTAAFQSGELAYGRGELVADCPYLPGDEMNDWLTGYFVAAEFQSEMNFESRAELPTDPEPEPEFALAANLDDI